MRFLIASVSTAAALLAVHAVIVFWVGLRAEISASDLQTNILRVQSLDSAREGSCIVLGSSISGRLRGEFFELEGRPVSVLGLDGLGSPFAATLLEQHGVDPAIVIVEANSLLVDNPVNAETLSDASSGSVELFAEIMPLARAEARPSAIVYSALKRAKDRGGESAVAAVPSPEVKAEQVGVEWDAASLRAIPNGLEGLLQSLIDRGTRVVITMVPDDPSGGKARPTESAAAVALASKLGVPYFDLRTQVSGLGLKYSDGLHLTEPSARTVARLLSAILNQLEPRK